MTAALLALRVALVSEHPDSIYTAWQSVRQARNHANNKGTERILAAIDEVLSAAYENESAVASS